LKGGGGEIGEERAEDKKTKVPGEGGMRLQHYGIVRFSNKTLFLQSVSFEFMVVERGGRRSEVEDG